MAHELDTRNGRVGMIYRGERPWHEHGRLITHEIRTTADACALAELVWTFYLDPLYRADGEKLGQRVKRFAIVRRDTGDVLGTCGPGWRAQQPADFFSQVQPLLDAGIGQIETMGTLRKGARIWCLIKIDAPDCVIVPGADDRVAKYILLAQGLDGVMGIHFGLTATRVVCANTLRAAIGDERSALLRIPHTAGAAAAVAAAANLMREANGKFEEVAKVYRALAGKQVTADAVRQYAERVFNPPKKARVDAQRLMAEIARDQSAAEVVEEAIAKDAERKRQATERVMELFEVGAGNDLPGVTGTAWAAYNAVTEHLTWNPRRRDDVRLDDLWFQDTGTSRRALEAAVDTFLAP